MINSENYSLDKKNIDTILVLDFGSQYTQLIARRIRELDIFSVILPWDISVEKIIALKPKGVITAQVGSQDKKPQQVENWLNVFNQNFGNAKLSRVYIPSFDCSWNFSSSINH